MRGDYSSSILPPARGSRSKHRCRPTSNCLQRDMPSPRPRRFDLIAFDWDGTLYDSTAVIVRCIQRAVVDVGGAMPTERAAAYVIGMSLTQALAHAAPDVPEDKYPELGARYRFHYQQHHEDLSLFD